MLQVDLVDVRNFPFPIAWLTLDGINSATRLRWLPHFRVALSVAGGADALFDLRTFHTPSSFLRLQPQLDQPANPYAHRQCYAMVPGF